MVNATDFLIMVRRSISRDGNGYPLFPPLPNSILLRPAATMPHPTPSQIMSGVHHTLYMTARYSG